jgi:hypothetical protein
MGLGQGQKHYKDSKQGIAFEESCELLPIRVEPSDCI